MVNSKEGEECPACDPLACLEATNNTAKAMSILKDGIHQKGVHMSKVDDKIKELVAG
jgi:hypothetical protein